ncbi:aldo/keto reductase [Acetanaerobacterium elongatum]|uniref:Aldo/keto reductase n=1 Tax=Acetanaerobacterium elongatum TaxID=258515 RepID=A0A1G9WA81_9FIRM|nr:aldo/keto reductase [Acetanaerobacterium elongatum]SDM81422.1 Aldo/keto reductase [Acetanaerobacterium elongatum]
MIGLGDEYALHNGVRIPCIGYGTWQMPDNEETVNNIKEAIACGYRHIDTASAYENEASVGKAVRESEVAREGLFITTKLWNSDHGYDNTLRAFEKSLSLLQMEYVDLYLIHWPVPVHHKEDYQELNRETWRAFERLYNEGRVKAIGVSNFLIHHLQEIMQDCEIKPMVNQVELHPEYPQQELADFCKNNNILVEAWSPLMQGRIFQLPLLRELGQKYGKSVSQIAIRWILQKGIVPLPKASGAEHIRQNADVFSFELQKEDMLKIDALKGIGRIGSDPEHIDF